MKSLSILVKMQLKEQLNTKKHSGEKRKIFPVLLAVVGAILKFAMVTGLCIAFLFVSETLGLFAISGQVIPPAVISLVFSVMLVMSAISCTAGLTKSMYYARDNAVLLTLPCPSIQVYLSKLIIFFLFEMKRNLSFLVPLFVAYYIYTTGYSWWCYIWMLFCMVWVSLFTTAIGALLSIPAMWIANFFRQHKWLQIASLIVIVSGATAALFFAISLIPENIDLVEAYRNGMFRSIQGFFDAYAKNFWFLYDITRMFLGDLSHMQIIINAGMIIPRFLIFAAVTIALLGLGILIVQPIFYKMASTPFEYLKKQVKPKKNVRRSPLVSSITTNFVGIMKDTTSMFTNVGILISVPMLVYLLNKIFLAMKTREMGDHMIIAFNILIILLIVLNANGAVASIFSRDGRSSYLIKTLPSKYMLPIATKLLPSTAFGVLSIAATYVILLLTLPLTPVQSLFIILSAEFIYIAHMLFSAEQDLMNPQTELYASVGSSESNPNEMKSTVSAFIIAFAVAALTFFLLIEGAGNVYLKLLLISIGALAYRIYTFGATVRLYYKEK